jgi:HlyD family secretion protein
MATRRPRFLARLGAIYHKTALSGAKVAQVRRWLLRIVLILVLVAAGWWLWSVFLSTDPVPVTVYRATRGRVEETVTNSRAGTVKARRRAKLSPEIGGRVVELPFREGDEVRAGDTLLRLDDSELIANRDLVRRDLEASRARETESCLAADLAVREWRRSQELFDEGIATAERLDRLESEKERQAAGCTAAKAAVKRSLAALRLAEARLEKSVLRAPFDGVIADLSTELGEWITPSPPAMPIPPVLDLIQPGSIYVSAPLDEVDAGRVRPNQPVRITLDPYPDREFPGQLVRIAPFVLDIEEQNRTFEVEVEFDDTEFAATLLPGTSADVEVILSSSEDRLRIPSYALLEGDEVLLVQDDRLVSQPLTIGLRNWEYAEVRDGLAVGDPVVISLDRPEVVAGAPAVISSVAEP